MFIGEKEITFHTRAANNIPKESCEVKNSNRDSRIVDISSSIKVTDVFEKENYFDNEIFTVEKLLCAARAHNLARSF